MAAVAIKDGYDKKVVLRCFTISALVGVMCFILKIGGEHYLLFVNLGLTPMYLLVLCWVFNKLSSLSVGKKALLPLSFMGLFTLELYRISSSFERLLTNEACPEHHVLFVLLWFVVSVLLSYVAYLLFKRINDFLYRKVAIII